MRRRNKIFLFLPALLVLGLAALAWSFLHTAPGAHWAWSQAVKNVPGSLKAASMAGDLRSGLVLNQVAYADENVHAEVNHLEIRLAFDLFPPAISIESLEIGQARLILLENRSETKPGSTADTIAGLALPLPISFRQVQIDELSVLDADETELLELNAMSLEGDWYQSLDLRKAGFQSGELAWVFDGSLELGAPFLLYARLDTHVPAGGGGLDFPADLNIESRMKGNLSEAEITVNTDLGGISVRGQLHDLLTDPGWELRLLSDSMDWPPGSSAPDVNLYNIQADISGWITDYKLLASAQADTADLPQAEVHLEARGNMDGLQINELNASSELLALKASGPLTWLDEFNFVFSTDLESFNPGFWVEDWPGDSPASGTLAVTWAGDRLSLDQLDIGVANSELRLTGSAAYKAGQDSIEGRLSWTSLKWPIGARQADFESPVGQVSLDGQLENWTASGSLELKSGDWPRGLIQATASGTQESVRIEVEEGQVLGGRFAGQFNYQWTDGQPWSARINASNLDVSSMAFAMAEGLTGVLNAKLEASGQTNPLAFSVDIKQLDGQINGQPLRADGSLVMDSGALKANALSVRSGNSRVLINGNAHQEEGMRFSGAIESLADFFENAAGSFSGEGRLSLNPDYPMLELNARGAGLVWDDWVADKLNIATEDLATGGKMIRLEIPSLLRGEQLIENVVISGGGDTPLETLQLSALTEGTRLDARLNGKISDWADFPNSIWMGTLETISLNNEELGFLRAEQATALEIGAYSLKLEPACFRGSRDGRVCLDIDWQDQQRFAANAQLDKVSLYLVQLVLGSHLEFSQTLTGEAHWEEIYGKKASADVRIALSPGQMSSEDETAVLLTGPGLFSFRISEGQLLEGNLDISLPGSGTIDTDFSVPDISEGVNSAIEGRVQVDLNSIESIMDWLPAIESASGVINADVRLAGTITEPKLTGHASLVRGRFEHLATGLVVTDIQLAGAVYDFDYTEMNGSFKSGDGRGQIKAAVQFDNILKPAITLELAGQNLTVIDIPDMTIKADTDLKLHWQDAALDLNGKVLIPSARIAPRYLPNASASESEDLVFVGAQPPELEESVFDRSRLRLNGNVEVELGDDVTVTFQRATAQLHGKSTFTWNNNLLPLANGTYTVSGKITAYGQLLEVSEGRVNFPNVPADNPHLNINAEREIYGNLQVKKAGVLISGTLKRPVLETYTIPATSRERALTLLVTGHDFDYEQGVGAVEVGMYIAPKLYVSYGVGLFEAQSVISARYDLGKGFGIKATSGQRETGADVTYTIEN